MVVAAARCPYAGLAGLERVMAIHIDRSGIGMVGRLVSDDPGIRSRKLMTMPYTDYLQTPEWDVTRRSALKAAEYRCQLCNGDGELHVHHRTYERRGVELPGDVIALCAGCHKSFHEHRLLSRVGEGES